MYTSAESVTRATELTAYAAANPEVIAVSTADADLTYAELDSWSNRLARILIGSGARPGSDVVVAVSRSIEFMVAAWAVAKSGAQMSDPRPNDGGRTPALAVTTKYDRARVGDVAVLLLDDLSTMRRYMTVSDAEVTESDWK